MYIMFSIDLLCKKITSMITYFAVIATYNLPRKNLKPPESFVQGAYISAHAKSKLLLTSLRCV